MNGLHEALDVGHLEAALVRCIIPRHCPVAWSVLVWELDPISHDIIHHLKRVVIAIPSVGSHFECHTDG